MPDKDDAQFYANMFIAFAHSHSGCRQNGANTNVWPNRRKYKRKRQGGGWGGYLTDTHDATFRSVFQLQSVIWSQPQACIYLHQAFDLTIHGASVTHTQESLL